MNFIALFFAFFITQLQVSSWQRFFPYKPFPLFSSEQHWLGRFVIACALSLFVELVLIFLSEVAYGLPVLILQCLFLFYLVIQANPAAILDKYSDYVKRGEWQSAYLHVSTLFSLLSEKKVSSEEIESAEALEKEVFANYVVLMCNVFFIPLLMFWLLGSVGLIFAVLLFDFHDDCPCTPSFFKMLRRWLQYPLVFTYYICGHSVAVWPVMVSGRLSDNSVVAAARAAIKNDDLHSLNSIGLLRSLHAKVLLIWLVIAGFCVIFGVQSPLY